MYDGLYLIELGEGEDYVVKIWISATKPSASMTVMSS